MTIIFLQNIFEKSINGEWGNEDSGKGEATAVIRTSNFLNSGRLNLDNIVCREIDKDKNSDKILRTGDIIIEKSGGSPNQPVGRVVYFDVTDQDYFTNNFTSILRVKPEYNSKYIFYLMKYLYDTKKVLKFQNQTTGIINLKLADYLNKTKVNIETIENQNTIVDILDRLEYQIINRNKQISELSNLVKSRFNEMFILNDFSLKRLGELVEEVRYGTSLPATLNGKYGYLRMNNITEDGKLNIQNLKYIDIPEKDLEKYVVRKGDVLFNRTNSIELVGKTCIYELNFDMVIAGYIIRIRTNNNIFNSRYLSEFLNFPSTKKFLRNIAKGAVNQANINAKELQDISVPLPPLALQNEFADFVAQVDKSQLAIQKSLEELETLKKSLMQEYFG
ncbi:restriction endonuclease subunit S [Streptococcus oralis]|uniref:restriction endonuclease subunit S n=1 Tax=Streptococcus oralis TaxID=1303 RepID=UPI0022841A09|nr:restriction endonuclease subunit S [Streptococcus oralis]MCY7103251.1 restriction endonuclease subunit S [Streptococcus oralis]